MSIHSKAVEYSMALVVAKNILNSSKIFAGREVALQCPLVQAVSPRHKHTMLELAFGKLDGTLQ